MIFPKQTIKDVSLDKKIVLVRVDYNVPITGGGAISDDLRIRASLPTLRHLLKHGCKIVIISHLGRPAGERQMQYTLAPVAKHLSGLLAAPVRFINDCIGDSVTTAVDAMQPGSIILLENLRFYPGEEQNSLEFAHAIAKSTRARYFVQDGFGVVHRAHASTSAITHFIPAIAGLLLEREVITIAGTLKEPKRPLIAILGGAKVRDKIAVIERFVDVADKIIVGGAMASTFLAYRRVPMGASKVETDQFSVLDTIYTAAVKKVGINKIDEFIILPKDVAVAQSINAIRRRTVPIQDIATDDMVLDIGDETIEHYVEEVKKAHTVIWNGTLGLAEKKPFAHGSARIALALATAPDLTSVIGGGDTADFALKWDGDGGKSFSHVSTGGGASLELIAGYKLPGVEALLAKKK